MIFICQLSFKFQVLNYGTYTFYGSGFLPDQKFIFKFISKLLIYEDMIFISSGRLGIKKHDEVI